MRRTVILRFRDMTVEDGGTIEEHTSLLTRYSQVWWGWWMRKHETPPRSLFKELSHEIERESGVPGFWFDVGRMMLYHGNMVDIAVAPPGRKLSSPDPQKSPSYYHRGEYPAWFLLNALEEVKFSDYEFQYFGFPSEPEQEETRKHMINLPVPSLEQLKKFDVTLWVVKFQKVK